MWTRSELKQKGKTAFLRNYWWCVLAAVILMLISSSGSSGRDSQNNNQNTGNSSYIYEDNESFLTDFDIDGNLDGLIGSADVLTGAVSNGLLSSFGSFFRSAAGLAVAATVTVFVLLIALLGVVLSILIFNPLKVGGMRFFVNNSRAAANNRTEKTGISEFLYAFTNGNYWSIVGTMFMMSLFQFLWTLCLIIPGIVKAYEYRMIPYLLAENPDMDRKEAFETSKSMMDGHKMDAFVLDLSFIGWRILSAFTLNLSGIFFSNPYQEATNAELYLTLLNGGRTGYYIGYENPYAEESGDQKFW